MMTVIPQHRHRHEHVSHDVVFLPEVWIVSIQLEDSRFEHRGRDIPSG